MNLKRLHLQNYRNIEFEELEFEGLYQYFLGKNGQGKTNLLESIGLLSSVRSFRTNDLKQLVQEHFDAAGLFYILEHEKLGEVEILLKFGSKTRELRVNGEIVKKLSDFTGLFPVIVLSSLDMEIVRGAPSVRRSFLDQLICSVDNSYFVALRNFKTALSSRNSLLKRNATNGEFLAFENLMGDLALHISESRRKHVDQMEAYFEHAYSIFAPEHEIPRICYLPDIEISDVESYRKFLQDNRERDKILKSTQRGPHRDDLDIRLIDRKAKEFASEGQQRGLVSALRICQITYTRQQTGVLPLIVADDILGEFDPERRFHFWSALREEMQVFASGTEMPTKSRRNWNTFKVSKGSFQLEGSTKE